VEKCRKSRVWDKVPEGSILFRDLSKEGSPARSVHPFQQNSDSATYDGYTDSDRGTAKIELAGNNVIRFFNSKLFLPIEACAVSALFQCTPFTRRLVRLRVRRLTEALTERRRADPGATPAVEVSGHDSAGARRPRDVTPPTPVRRVEARSSAVHGPAGRLTGIDNARRPHRAPVLYTRVVRLAQPVLVGLLVLQIKANQTSLR